MATQKTWYWHQTVPVTRRLYRCGYCGSDVGPSEGYFGVHGSNPALKEGILICPACERPTYFTNGGVQTPGPLAGRDVAKITDKGVKELHGEMRRLFQVSAFTSVVLLGRKILAHVAVSKGATTGANFVTYVEFLLNAGWLPPNGKTWVDELRKKGNEGNHEIVIFGQREAETILKYTQLLLSHVFEMEP